MRCSHAQAAISASMDGGVLPAQIRSHVDGCSSCQGFADAAQRIRVAARRRVAEEVPDLVSQIMTLVREEAVAPVRERAHTRDHGRARVGGIARVHRRSLIAAALAGAIVGSALMSAGLLPSRRVPAALADSIPHEIAAAAENLSAFQADYQVTEHGWRADVPVRTFDVSVAFASPEGYRVDVTDTTRYPRGSSASNDSQLIVDGARWSLTGPQTCVPALTTPCPASGQTDGAAIATRVVTGRPPFDPDAQMPTDIILPVTSLAGSSDIDVLGQGTMAGHPAVEIALFAQDASPLFAFFQQAGSWIPMYPSDHVTLWLDKSTWFPLEYTVTSAGGQDRAIWSERNGTESQPEGTVVLQVKLNDLSTVPPNEQSFAVKGTGSDEGFHDLPISFVRSIVGFAPAQPENLVGLRPYRSGYFEGQPGEAVLSYSAGLTWLRLRETRSWGGHSLFGNVDAFAQEVALPGGGTAYYEAASDQEGRRLAIHASGVDLVLESNLPPETLFRIAASIPVDGLAIPDTWRIQHPAPGVTVEQMSVADLVRRGGFAVLQPAKLPPGYQLSAAQLTTFNGGIGATVFYSRAGLEPARIRLYQSPGETIPPAPGTDLAEVSVRGATGRWSPDQHQLEWVENGIYRSVTAPGLELNQILSIADSLETRS